MHPSDNLLSTEIKVPELVYLEEQRINRNTNFIWRSFAASLTSFLLVFSHAGNIFGLLEYEGSIFLNLNMEMNF